MKKVIISAALTGTAGSKAQSPDIPITPEEIAADTVAVAKAGASMVHIHVHDEEGRPTMDTKYFRAAFEAVKEATEKAGVDVIVNLTTSGGEYEDYKRLQHLSALQPDLCSFDPGTLNWANSYIFENSPRFLNLLADEVVKTEQRTAACIDELLKSRYKHAPKIEKSHEANNMQPAEKRFALLGNKVYRMKE